MNNRVITVINAEFISEIIYSQVKSMRAHSHPAETLYLLSEEAGIRFDLFSSLGKTSPTSATSEAALSLHVCFESFHLVGIFSPYSGGRMC